MEIHDAKQAHLKSKTLINHLDILIFIKYEKLEYERWRNINSLLISN